MSYIYLLYIFVFRIIHNIISLTKHFNKKSIFSNNKDMSFMLFLRKIKSKLPLIVSGIAIGIVNGFFGGGGGMVCVPILEKL
jgi:hypothetical protein